MKNLKALLLLTTPTVQIKTGLLCWEWWPRPLLPALGRWRQESEKFKVKVILGEEGVSVQLGYGTPSLGKQKQLTTGQSSYFKCGLLLLGLPNWRRVLIEYVKCVCVCYVSENKPGIAGIAS